MIAEDLDSMAERVLHSTSSHGVSVSHPRWRTDPHAPPHDKLSAVHGIPEDLWIEWMNESSGICLTAANFFSRCVRLKRDEKGITYHKVRGVGF